MRKERNKDYVDFTIRLPIELKEYVEEVVEDYGIPRATLIRKMIEQVKQDGFKIVSK